MAAKKRPSKKMPATAGPKWKTMNPVRMDLTEEEHRLLRIIAAHYHQSMASYSRQVLAQHLREEAKRLGFPL